jgi:hypothetical protein
MGLSCLEDHQEEREEQSFEKCCITNALHGTENDIVRVAQSNNCVKMAGHCWATAVNETAFSARSMLMALYAAMEYILPSLNNSCSASEEWFFLHGLC